MVKEIKMKDDGFTVKELIETSKASVQEVAENPVMCVGLHLIFMEEETGMIMKVKMESTDLNGRKSSKIYARIQRQTN